MTESTKLTIRILMEQSKQKIVIIGAGISAMKAAFDLAKSGNYHVTVLEAQDRIGGRTKANIIKLNDKSQFAFDLGASWIHQSCQKHPITNLAKEAEMKCVKTDEKIIIYYNQKGAQIP